MEMLNDTFIDASLENTAMGRYYKALGIGMHLIGDTFAHRTIVPAYTVAGTNPSNPVYSTSITSANAKFGSSDFKSGGTLHSDAQLRTWAKSSSTYKESICKYWKCFQRAVNLGVIEFKDIKNFGIEEEAKAAVYEDNKSFCSERYADAELGCEFLLDYADSRMTYEGALIFCPTETYVKLNNFKGYTEKANESTSVFTDAMWNDISTPAEY